MNSVDDEIRDYEPQIDGDIHMFELGEISYFGPSNPYDCELSWPTIKWTSEL